MIPYHKELRVGDTTLEEGAGVEGEIEVLPGVVGEVGGVGVGGGSWIVAGVGVGVGVGVAVVVVKV